MKNNKREKPKLPLGTETQQVPEIVIKTAPDAGNAFARAGKKIGKTIVKGLKVFRGKHMF